MQKENINKKKKWSNHVIASKYKYAHYLMNRHFIILIWNYNSINVWHFHVSTIIIMETMHEHVPTLLIKLIDLIS